VGYPPQPALAINPGRLGPELGGRLDTTGC
jgi:hypothetical protein